MSEPVKVAVLQMTSTPDVEANLTQVSALLTQAKSEAVELAVLPEAFFYLGPETTKASLAEPMPKGGPILDQMQHLARQCDMALVLGGFWERHPDPNDKRVRNTCVYLNSKGEITALYRKIHLFDVTLPDGTILQESSKVEPGPLETTVVDSPVGPLGLSICYDVRFPELYRQLVDNGAECLAIPAAFTAQTGKDHWHILLRARAIESQCFVLAAAQVGHHHGNRYSYGHAMIVDPWGTVLAECHEDKPSIAITSIDRNVTQNIRAQLPSLRHRRLK